MNTCDKEQQIKLNILDAIARSQKALASMAETVANTYVPVADRHGHSQEPVARELRIFSRYQLVLAEKILGIRIRHRRFGTPCPPWLQNGVIGGQEHIQPAPPT